MTLLRKLGAILGIPPYLRLAVGMGAVYLVLFLVALQDISLGASRFQFVTGDWSRALDRTGAFTFEPVAMLALPGGLGLPGVTVLISPVNVLMGGFISVLVGLNLVVTWIAFRQPRACSFNRSTGVLASVPALLAGSACCAPAIVLILGIQLSSALVTVFQVLIPVSVVLLLATLKLILDRTNPELIRAA